MGREFGLAEAGYPGGWRRRHILPRNAIVGSNLRLPRTHVTPASAGRIRSVGQIDRSCCLLSARKAAIWVVRVAGGGWSGMASPLLWLGVLSPASGPPGPDAKVIKPWEDEGRMASIWQLGLFPRGWCFGGAGGQRWYPKSRYHTGILAWGIFRGYSRRRRGEDLDMIGSHGER
jgi:hypothetical protein